jgi:putative phage-type endonuclease
VAAVVGLSPFRSAVQVWAEKVGHGTCGPASGLHLRFGAHLEPFVAAEYERVTGSRTHVHAATLRHPSLPYLFGHLDRLVTPPGQNCVDEAGTITADTLLECKTASAFSAGEWGRPWTDEVPASYLVQCAWYMMLSGCSQAHLAVLLGNAELRVYVVRRDEQLEVALFEAAKRFWVGHVLTGVPPEPATREDVLRLYPEHEGGLSVEAKGHHVEGLRRLARLRAGIAELRAQAEAIKDELAAAMGPAERLTHAGQVLASWRTSRPACRLDVSKLRRERPELAQAFTVEAAPVRRLHIRGEGT